MKKTCSLVLSLLILIGLASCSFGRESTRFVVATKSAGTQAAAKTTAGRAGTTAPASEAEKEETLSEPPESRHTDDFQAGVPEEHRLKINVPASWNDPLPAVDKDFFSPLFGVGRYLDEQQQTDREPLKLPRVVDLFTIEELEAYFGMTVVLSEEGRNIVIANRDKELYLLYRMDASKPAFWDGKVELALQDCGDRLSALTYMTMIASEPREIEGLGERALFTKWNSVYILVTDSVLLSISAKFKPPEGGMPEHMDEEPMLELARYVYARFMESMAQAP